MAIALSMPTPCDQATSSRVCEGTTVALISSLDICNHIRKYLPQFFPPSTSSGTPTTQEIMFVYAEGSSRQLDKAATLSALNKLKALHANWNGYGAAPISRKLIQAAENFILGLQGALATTPKVVPMTRGRLQLEWHTS